MEAQVIEWIETFDQIENLHGVNFQDNGRILLSGSTSQNGVFIEIDTLGNVLTGGFVFEQNQVQYSTKIASNRFLHFNYRLFTTDSIGQNTVFLYDSLFMHNYTIYENSIYIHNQIGDLVEFNLNSLDSTSYQIGEPNSKLESLKFNDSENIIACYNKKIIDSTGNENIYLDIVSKKLSGELYWSVSIPKEHEFDHYILIGNTDIYILSSEYELDDFGVAEIKTVVTKINQEGDLLWTQEYRSSNGFRPIRYLSCGMFDDEGNINFIGSDGSVNIVPITNTLLLKIDTNGNVLFDSELDAPGIDKGLKLKILTKDEFLVVGSANLNDTPPFGKSYLMKVNPILSQSSDVKSDIPEIKIFPNPICDKFQIPRQINHDKVEIFNIEGNKMNFQKHERSVNINNLPNGSYFIIFSKNRKITARSSFLKICT